MTTLSLHVPDVSIQDAGFFSILKRRGWEHFGTMDDGLIEGGEGAAGCYVSPTLNYDRGYYTT